MSFIDSHADIAVACANAKRHILIEKPLATTREDVYRSQLDSNDYR
ncbi:MAG TPA: Gfo/Idh/MocA family oxidoreductase [Clostridiaceae bacterium]|nr:Gfo/Idh/MocA family oxidoreductase [Clostridiaceae bacterium]